MDLVTRFLAARRDKLLMRLGCWLVCFSLVLGLMLPQQKAEALVAELSMTAVTSLAAAYFGACGMSFIFVSPDPDKDPKNDLVRNIQRLIQEFLDTDLGGISIQTWLGDVWELFLLNRKLVVGRHLLDKLMEFAQWVAGKYAAQAGENVVCNDYIVPLADGGTFYLSWSKGTENDFALGTSVSYNEVPILFATGYHLECEDSLFRLFSPSEKVLLSCIYGSGSLCYIGFDYSKNTIGFMNSRGINLTWLDTKHTEAFLAGSSLVNLSIDRAPSMSYIPDGIAAEQGIALDVGAAATMDLDLVLQGVLEDVLAGTLTSTMTAAGEAVVDPPVEEEVPDVDGLGLPALGQALTSRFPFSIPWDFFRAVQLLAAPAKAPYFEVDFMEPLADEVGGWKGSTKVVLDFSEYEIIGQVCRWTSTIGFCLMLAMATKRLIWTA